jgi:uncharacterized protein
VNVKNSRVQVIRQTSYTTTPWKNGGGITHEAIRVPAGEGPFRWRVSVANIDASGPFSEFAAYNRKMVLLKGAGIDLRFADGTRKTLRRVGELVEFDGASPVQCDLLNGPCVDFNLMVSKTHPVSVRVERFSESMAVRAARDERTLVFAVDQRVTLDIDEEKAVTLEPWDLAVLSHCAGRINRPGSVEWGSTSVFVAALKLVSGE